MCYIRKWYWRHIYSLNKITQKIICVQKHSSRGVIQERCSASTKQTHRRTTTQKHDLNKAATQLYLNHTPTHSCTPGNSQHTRRTPLSRRTTLRDWLLMHDKRVLKDVNYKKLLFTVVERNLLTLKINK